MYLCMKFDLLSKTIKFLTLDPQNVSLPKYILYKSEVFKLVIKCIELCLLIGF